EDGSTNDVVHADVPPGIWGLFCRVITDDPAEIGNEDVLAQGVIQAVDVFSPNGADGAGTTICLLGEGSIMFLDASQAPRVPQWLPTTYDGTYTCATIPGTGIVV